MPGPVPADRQPGWLQQTASCPEPLAPPCAATAGPGPGGRGWWLGQPRFEPWHQQQHRWSEDYARKAAGREERCLAGGVHAAEGRAACGAVQKASHDQLYQALGLSTVELEVLGLNHKHEQVLTAAGTQVRITAGSAKAGRLLWPAAQTDGKHQARALFAWAR